MKTLCSLSVKETKQFIILILMVGFNQFCCIERKELMNILKFLWIKLCLCIPVAVNIYCFKSEVFFKLVSSKAMKKAYGNTQISLYWVKEGFHLDLVLIETMTLYVMTF